MYSSTPPPPHGVCVCKVFIVVVFYTHFLLKGGVSIVVDSVTTTTLTISWLPANGVTADSYSVFYTNTNCTSDTYDFAGISPSVTVYTLPDLQEGTHYSITVIVGQSGGETGENTIIATTMDAGKRSVFNIMHT